MKTVVIQKGHCFRKRGSTGTAGHRGTEQEFVNRLGTAMHKQLASYDNIKPVIVLADPIAGYPDCDVFVALHQDGSDHKAARGASIGYPTNSPDGGKLGQIWKALYQQAGWPSGFRPDNYTAGLRNYYANRRVNAPCKLLIEHGFATNQADANWMWDNLTTIAAVNADAIARYLQADPGNSGDTDTMALELIIDTEGAHEGEHWIIGGTAPIDITNSTARARHVQDFTDAGAVKRLRYGGDIVRKAYPPAPELPTIELAEGPELPTAEAIAAAVFAKQRELWLGN